MKQFSFLLFCCLCQLLPAQQSMPLGVFDLDSHPERDTWVQSIRVIEPALRSDVEGEFMVRFQAPGMKRASARCVEVLTPEGIELDDEGNGCFNLNAKELNRGPIQIQIFADNLKGTRDIFELQLYNVTPKAHDTAGIPDTIPAPAKGMRVAYSDDFTSQLSISKDGRGTLYNAHKPFFGDFSGWPFADPDEEGPFAQRDDYLIIKARKENGTKGRSGLLATVDMDGKGYRAKAPFYMECRLLAQSGTGTWPAFWTITNPAHGPGDELDVIEAYGGWGKGNPNSTGYWVTSHYWAQYDDRGKPLEHPGKLIHMTKIGRKTSWSEEFHTYGVYVDQENTIYYLDDIEVCRMPTNILSFTRSHIPMINYAIGGSSGWYIDLERYGNASDMYVDYLRIFEK